MSEQSSFFGGIPGYPGEADLKRLSEPLVHALTAEAVSRLLPDLPPSFHVRMPLRECVEYAWNCATGTTPDLMEAERLYDVVTEMGMSLSQEKQPPGAPGEWLDREGYNLYHARTGEYIVRMFADYDTINCSISALESAGGIWRYSQCRRLGCFQMVPDSEYRLNVYHMFGDLCLALWEFALAWQGPPVRGMFDPVPSLPDPPELPPSVPQWLGWQGDPWQKEWVRHLRSIGRWRLIQIPPGAEE